jgi:hypothetical protein
MAHARALKARERALEAGRKRRLAGARGGAHAGRKLSREEAIALIAKKSPRGAWLLQGYLAGVPARRGGQ